MKGFCFLFEAFDDPASEFVVTGGREEEEVDGTKMTARDIAGVTREGTEDAVGGQVTGIEFGFDNDD